MTVVDCVHQQHTHIPETWPESCAGPHTTNDPVLIHETAALHPDVPLAVRTHCVTALPGGAERGGQGGHFPGGALRRPLLPGEWSSGERWPA